MASIIGEVRRNVSLATDIDSFRSRYLDVIYDYKGNIDIEVYFPAFSIYAYDKNFFVLLAKSKKEKFKPRWQQRPDYTSHDIYGSVIYWPLILYVNRINSIEDYKNIETVLIPPFNIIFEISKVRVPVDDINSLEEDYTYTEYNYYRLHPLEQEQTITGNNEKIDEFPETIRPQGSIIKMLSSEDNWVVRGGSF